MSKLIHEELTYEIKSILFDVYNKLGPMLPEEFYERPSALGWRRGVYRSRRRRSSTSITRVWR